MHTAEPGALRARLAPAQVDLLLIHVLRCRGIFSEALLVLEPEFFRPDTEAAHRALWSACLAYYREFQESPSGAVLRSEAAALIDSQLNELMILGESRTSVHQQILREQEGLLTAIGTLTEQELYEPYGLELLRKFLQERSVFDGLRSLLEAPADAVPVHLEQCLDRYQDRMLRVAGVNARVTTGVFDGDVDRDRGRRVLVGIPYLDRYLVGPPDLNDRPTPGGHCGGECYTIVGAFGSGKTTQTTQLCGETIQRFVDLYGAEAPQRYAALFTYELSPDVLVRQLVSHVARVPRCRLMGPDWLSRLSDAEHLTEYDRTMCGGASERDRVEMARPVLRAFRCFDFRGSPQAPQAGRGYVQEIQAELEKLRTREGLTPGIVVIDYASLCVRRHLLSGQNLRGDLDKLNKQLLTMFCDTVRRLVAIRYGCPVWVMHQLSGMANSRAPGSRVTIADAAGDKSWGENFDGVFILHRQDRESGCVALACEKARYSPPDGDTYLIRFDPHLNRMIPAQDEYVLDLSSRRIQRRSVLEKFVTPEELARSGAAPSARSTPADDLGFWSR